MTSLQLGEGGPSVSRIRPRELLGSDKASTEIALEFQLLLHSSVNCLDLDDKLSAP